MKVLGYRVMFAFPGIALASVAAAVFPAPHAGAQTSALIWVDQVPTSLSSPAKRRGAAHVLPRAGREGQLSQTAQSRGPTGQIAARTNDTRIVAVPSQLVDACETAQGRRAPVPRGVDCKTVLEAAAAAPRRPTPEEALLGIAPPGTTSVASVQRANLPDANTVARRLATGDVQGAPIAEAVGAIAQQNASGSAPK